MNGGSLRNFFRVSEGEARIGKYLIILSLLLLMVWIGHDYILKQHNEISKTTPSAHYSFEYLTPGQVRDSLAEETRRLVSQEDETIQLIAFVHILERYSYLLYTGEISQDNFYESLGPFILPARKSQLKKKQDYAQEINRYLGRLRGTGYRYLGYTVGKPEFQFSDYARVARVELVMETSSGNERRCYLFRRYKDRYYLDFE